MGLETMAIIGGAMAISGAANATEQAEASARQANKTLENMTTDILAQLGRQKASFVGSGIALDADTGVYNVLSNTVSVGLEDLNLYAKNAQTQIDNQYKAGVMNSIMQGAQVASLGAGGAGGGAGSFAGLSSLFGGGGTTGTQAPATSANTGANTGGTSGFANFSNLFQFGEQ